MYAPLFPLVSTLCRSDDELTRIANQPLDDSDDTALDTLDLSCDTVECLYCGCVDCHCYE